MIIITADDYGKNSHATDSILKCFSSKSITSASAMVFMEDSERAAPLALQAGMEVGLHINFTMPFNADKVSSNILEHHSRVVAYLIKSKLAQIIYNPLLAGSFEFLYKRQLEEFMRLYGKFPDFYNGHHHMHLCANMLMGKILPKGTRARRTFTFDQADKYLFNLLYRRLLDIIVARRFISTDSFFSILPLQNYERLRNIFNRAVSSNVEIEVHPENADEIEYLLSDQYLSLLESAQLGNFHKIAKRR